MSTQLTHPPKVNGHDRKPDGVRTYRGRKLEDLIPQIRAELGPDAIILREREGLMGGLNGFFAQRCVEVDAKAAPRIDIYDEDHDEPEQDAPPASVAAEETEEIAELPVAEEPAASPAIHEDDELQGSAVAPEFQESSFGAQFDLSSFAAQLEEAATAPEPEVASAAPEPFVAPAPATPELEAAPAPIASEPAPATPAHPPAPATPDPDQMRDAIAARLEEAIAARVEEALAARLEQAAPVAAPAAPDAEATPVRHELVQRGISESWAHELTGAAAAHRSPFTSNGDLREAVRATLARSLPASAPLAASGAAVAFVGAGGAGKTRCVAALAAAYARASTLPVTVVSLCTADRGRALADLLRTHGVDVVAATDTAGAAEAVETGRKAGLVVIDTASATPGDEAAMGALTDQLEPLGLDGLYITVPATISAHAARRLVETFEPLQPTDLAVTHVDGADQLGIAAELSYSSGIPIGFIHEGLDVDRALSAPDPMQIGARLLP
jgi:flagellar biosynthesis GTPase FlhF